MVRRGQEEGKLKDAEWREQEADDHYRPDDNSWSAAARVSVRHSLVVAARPLHSADPKLFFFFFLSVFVSH